VDKQDFSTSPIGDFTPISGYDPRFGDFSVNAYLPYPLPSDQEISIDNPAWAAVSHATEMVGRLDQECSHMPDPSLLIRPALLREAMDTSALEGTVGILTDLLEAQLPDAGPLSSETKEIRAYESAALNAFEEIKIRPISVGFLCQIQAEIFQHATEPPMDLGEVRHHQVCIGSKDRPITEARFIPPPGDDRLRSGLEGLLNWIEEESTLPTVLRAALAHYQFETLHPFGDGNGRVGRLLVILHFLRSGKIREPAITLSPWLLPRRSEYQDALLEVTRSGNWSPWVSFFCEAIAAQCQSLIVGARGITLWQKNAIDVVQRNHWSGLILRIIDDLGEWPLLTISAVTEKHNVSFPAAKKAIDRLVTIGILREMTGKNYNRVFCADGVISLVESI
jgi:Fic family protein